MRHWFDIRPALQIIPAWQEFFGHPSGKVLGTTHEFTQLIIQHLTWLPGLVNAAQSIGCVIVSLQSYFSWPRSQPCIRACLSRRTFLINSAVVRRCSWDHLSCSLVLRCRLGPKRCLNSSGLGSYVRSTAAYVINANLFIEVGFGLQFSFNAAPLLLIELAYPTQVCDTAAARTQDLTLTKY